jgi:type IV pilus assembly protein PilV
MLNKISHNRALTPRKFRGDTMIEVLVTVLILAVGVLGVAAMQVTTLQNLSTSHSASVAELLADGFAERMRANSPAALADTYLHNTAPGAFTDCVANVCNPTQLASYDIGNWWIAMQAALPSAAGTVTRVGGTGTFIVTVRWDEDRSGSAGVNCPIVSAADLECYQFRVTIGP